MDEILQEKDYVAAQKDIKTLGQNHVYFLPYLMGERSPHNDPLARACFMGMTMDTGRADMIQAVFEGVAFAMRDSLEVARSQGIDIKRTKICGGGAKSPLWCKIMANVLNLQVDLLEVEEGPALGGCHACSRRLRCLRIRRRSGRCDVRVADTISPEPALVEAYEKRYATFRQIYPALKEIFPQV